MPMPALSEELLIHGPVLLDGAWGTEPQARGLASGESGDFWNLDPPERVEEVARSRVDAVSQVVLTNAFRANPSALAKHPARHRPAEVDRAGVATCRRAVGDRARVFGSIRPSGKPLPTREVDPESLRRAFAEPARALAEGGADALVIETISDLDELRCAIEAARETGLPVVARMVYDTTRPGDRTLMGVTPEQAAWTIDELGADCGSGIEVYMHVCRRLAAATERPICIRANAGIPRLSSGRVVYPTEPDPFASHADDLVAAGARFVGGGCGTDPAHIRALAARLGAGARLAGARER